jgi:hypothetical protein
MHLEIHLPSFCTPPFRPLADQSQGVWLLAPKSSQYSNYVTLLRSTTSPEGWAQLIGSS